MYTIGVYKTKSGQIYIEITPTRQGAAPVLMDPINPSKRAMREALQSIGRDVSKSITRADLSIEFMWVFESDIHAALVAARLAH